MEKAAYKVGDRVTIHHSEFSIELLSVMGITYGIIHYIVTDKSHSPTWSGPTTVPGYHLNLFDKNDNKLPGGPYYFHEPELIKICNSKPATKSQST